jgi:leader peptidase (prepilin peptidase)/N-methyltransferase
MFSTLFLLMVAPAVGSFLGALIDRLPREEDILRAPSRCRSCGTRLRAVDLVPLLSFVVLRGKCRYCAAPLPGWLPLMELAAFGLAGLAVLRGGDDWQIWTSAGVLWLLLALGVCDLLWFRLPDALTAALAALCLGAAVGNGLGMLALAGGLLGAGAFLALRVGYMSLRGREGLGLGDVKLMAGLGALTGPAHLPLLVLVAALGALLATLILRWGGGVRGGLRGDLALPFGAALTAAGGALWLMEKTLI